jgi:putative Mg2+ transporter-C (MgtC) family protein
VDADYSLMALRLGLAMLAGGIIGLERAMHGREAGFRTHALVCVSSSLLMVLMVYQWELVPIKEGLTVRGLTTAASIWMTASIGIVIGMGLFFPAMLATIITVLTLSVFRWFESILPAHMYAKFSVRFIRGESHADEEALRSLISQHNIKAFESSYHLSDEGKSFEYEMTVRTRDKKNFRNLAQSLMDMDDVNEFKITPC